MPLFTRDRSSSFSKFINKILNVNPNRKHSLAFLNTSQFLGIVNDNIFKLILVFLLIEVQGAAKAGSILSIAGAIYVIPFLLFSSSAGVLADKFSKQRLLVLMKAFEIVIMIIAIAVFALKNALAGYTLLFLLSIHSAMFGPSKYGIIPEVVPSKEISRANGLITSFTYLGIIIGTFLASFLTELTNHNFPLTVGFCLLLAIIGFASTFGIKYTSPQGSKKRINFLFISEIYRTLKFSLQIKHLFVAIFGSAFFLFVGSFAQLNIIPFAIHSLGLSDVAGGYLFLSTALGIALGSFLAGKASKLRVELGISCLAGLALFLLQVALWIFSSKLIAVIICLILLGIAGGIFIVPFDSFIQLNSPHEKRGQVIAAANFLGFAGVLVASFSLYLFSEVIGLSSAAGFAWIGIITLFFSLLLISRLSDLALPYIAKVFVKPFYSLTVAGQDLFEKSPGAVLILEEASWPKAFLLMTVVPGLQIVMQRQHKRHFSCFPWFNHLFYSIHFVDKTNNIKSLIALEESALKEHETLCIWIDKNFPREGLEIQRSFKEVVTGSLPTFLFVNFERTPKRGVQLIFSKSPRNTI